MLKSIPKSLNFIVFRCRFVSKKYHIWYKHTKAEQLRALAKEVIIRQKWVKILSGFWSCFKDISVPFYKEAQLPNCLAEYMVYYIIWILAYVKFLYIYAIYIYAGYLLKWKLYRNYKPFARLLRCTSASIYRSSPISPTQLYFYIQLPSTALINGKYVHS